jgi:hypothetical protein
MQAVGVPRTSFIAAFERQWSNWRIFFRSQLSQRIDAKYATGRQGDNGTRQSAQCIGNVRQRCVGAPLHGHRHWIAFVARTKEPVDRQMLVSHPQRCLVKFNSSTLSSICRLV